MTRAAPTAPGQVAVVIGGGSGHYPAFSGLVGRGLAHGAVVGNVFASPSAQQICSVAREAQAGGGVLLSYGNYAGDVLHFGAAAERLAAEGIEVRQRPGHRRRVQRRPDELSRRRGVAGDLVVFKVAGAAADRGLPLAEVTRLAELANERTRSFGVAFAGCTLPGSRRAAVHRPGPADGGRHGRARRAGDRRGRPAHGRRARPSARVPAARASCRAGRRRPGRAAGARCCSTDSAA